MIANKIVWTTGISTVILLIALVAVLEYKPDVSKTAYLVNEAEPVIFMSSTCDCCSDYVSYLEDQGVHVRKEYVDETSSVKSRYGIPENMQSCHTVVFDDYFIEGHVPLEIIEKLLEEQPNIAGIALPGMPKGAPGMSGVKLGTLDIYAIGHDGAVSLFTTL